MPSFIGMSDWDKFKFILSSNDYDINTICIQGINNMYGRRLSYN